MTPTEATWVPLLILGLILFGLGAFYQSKRGCSRCRGNDRHTSIVQSTIELVEAELAAGNSRRNKAARNAIRVLRQPEHPVRGGKNFSRGARFS